MNQGLGRNYFSELVCQHSANSHFKHWCALRLSVSLEKLHRHYLMEGEVPGESRGGFRKWFWIYLFCARPDFYPFFSAT